MTAVSWRDGVPRLRRLVVAEGADPDRIDDVDLAWRAFRAFLTMPLNGLFDRWESDDVEADTLVVECGVSGLSDELPVLLLARRFSIPAVEWHDGVPAEPGSDEDDVEVDVADTVQIEVELTFAHDTTAQADDFWTAVRSGEFSPADLAEAEQLVTRLGLGQPVRSRIELANCN
jgi:hypothetical protein